MVPVWLSTRVAALRLLGLGRAGLVFACLALLAFASGLSVVVGQEATREYRFEGRANVDGAPAPKGTVVEIRVNGEAVATSQVTDEQGTWAIVVDANVLKQGVCDATFYVGGKQAERQWNRCTVSIVLEVSKPPVTTPPIDDPKKPTPIEDPEDPPVDDPDDPDDPPSDNDDPPGDDDDPPGDDNDLPGDDDDPPGDDDDPPGDDDVPPGDDDVPPGDDDVPPGDDDVPPGDDDVPPSDDPPADDPPDDDSPTDDPPADDPSTDDEVDDTTTPPSDASDDDGGDGDDSTADSSTQRPGAPPQTGSGGLIKDGEPSVRLGIAIIVATIVVVGIAVFPLPRRRRS